MKQTINILIFKLLMLFAASIAAASPIYLSQDSLLELETKGDRPVTITTNFEIEDLKLITIEDNEVQLEILKKGFVLIPKSRGYKATIVLSARDGSIYTISLSGGGKKAMFRLDDPMQTYNKKGKAFEFESARIDTDARNIIKTILLNKKLAGFKKEKAYQSIKVKQYNISRIERYVGGKYVVDRWVIKNTTLDSLYFNEEDFYTEGVLAVAVEKNRVLTGESIFLITILNKHSIYNKAKDD